jgi:hypothetical protein
MRLNLGCGYKKYEGWVNVDIAPACEPDLLVDLEKCPWPWETDSIDEMQAVHSLEHLGQDRDLFLSIIKECYRVLKPGAMFRIHFPDVYSDKWWSDPTHVRPLTPKMFKIFSKSFCRYSIAQGWANTAYAIYHGIDFEMLECHSRVDMQWCPDGKVPDNGAHRLLTENNFLDEWRVVLQKVAA